MKYAFLFFLVLAQTCFGQECVPEDHPEPDNAFVYARAEIKALHWIKQALAEEGKIPAPAPPGDPKRAEKAATRNTIARGLTRYYDCAAKFVEPYRDSKNKNVRESVDAILSGIAKSNEVNGQVLEELQQIDKTPSSEEVDPRAMKRLVDLTKVEDNARTLIMGGVKLSTYGLVRERSTAEETIPIAFTITAKQHETLLAETKELAKKKNIHDVDNLIDKCAEILRMTLTQQLPFASE